MQHVLNYGSVLQAYSLQEMIKKLTGEDVVFLELNNPPHIDVNMPIKDKDDYVINKHEPVGKVLILKKIVNKLKNRVFIYKIHKFQKLYFKVENISEGNSYDLIIEGSDEVFKCSNKLNLHMYGGIACSKRLITYAAACGSVQLAGIPDSNLAIVKKAMSNFSAMSVRDSHTAEYVAGLGCSEIYHHLDPVLVGDLYKRKYENVGIRNYIVIYAYAERIRSESEINEIRSFAKKRKLKTVAIGGPQNWCDTFIPADPFKVLDYFYHANYIITDTFHGTVFSIITNSKFSVIPRRSNVYKIKGLLEDLSLRGRILNDIQMLDENFQMDIEWASINELLKKERERSLQYLRTQINAQKEIIQ